MTSYNIQYFASYISSLVEIQERVIRFGPTNGFEYLLEVPLGYINPRDTIAITIAIDNSYPNEKESDIIVGIYDGTNEQRQVIVDIHNYASLPPCFPIPGQNDQLLVSQGTKVPAIFKLIYTPYDKYAACSTAQEGGYVNTGTFDNAIDTSKPLSLRFHSDNESGETYFVKFIDIEIY